jgi:hypothetical protein
MRQPLQEDEPGHALVAEAGADVPRDGLVVLVLPGQAACCVTQIELQLAAGEGGGGWHCNC